MNLRVRLALAFALLFAPMVANAGSGAGERKSGSPERLVVVARIVDLKEATIDCSGCIDLDQHFVATYEVLRTLRGQAPGKEIVFDVGDHGSFPDFAETQTAVLFLKRLPDCWVLLRYQGFAVDPTVDGRWAMCRREPDADELDAIAQGAAPRLPAPRPIRFAADVVFDDVSRWSSADIAEKFPSPTFEVRAGRVRCTRGIYVEEYVDAQEAWSTRRAHRSGN